MPEYLSSAVVLIALFACFIGLVIWAWSKNRNSTFNHASHLPLEDDEAYINDLEHSANPPKASKADLK